MRDFSLITYLSETDLLKVLSSHSQSIFSYIYIYHSKDLSVPHIHLVIRTRNDKTSSAVLKWFKWSGSANTLIEKVFSPSIVAYLTHENQPDKYQYSSDDLRSDNIDFWQKFKLYEKSDNAVYIIDDIIAEVPLRTLVQRYGRDFVINYDKYKRVARIIQAQDLDNDSYWSIYGEAGRVKD